MLINHSKKFSHLIFFVLLLMISTISYAATGSISGTVTDTNGQPIPNVNVTSLYPDSPSEWYFYNSTKTDGNGMYLLDGLETYQPYRVLFEKDSFLFEYYNNAHDYAVAESIAVTENANTLINVVLGDVQTGIIKGRVTNNAGDPLEGIAISATFVRNSIMYGKPQVSLTDANGEYSITRLFSGDYSLSFSSSLYENYKYPSLVTVDANTTVENINAQLEKSGIIRGTVVDVNGLPLEGVKVFLCLAYGNQIDPDSCYNYYGDDLGLTKSDGKYMFVGINSETFHLGFSRGGYTEYYKDVTSFEDAQDIIVDANVDQVFNVVLGAPDSEFKENNLTGIVKDSHGNTLKNVIVRVYHSNNGDWSAVDENDFIATASTKTDGSYTFYGLLNGVYRISFDYTAAIPSLSQLGAKGKKNLASLPPLNNIEYYKDATSLQDATDINIEGGKLTVIKDVLIGVSDDPLEVSVEATDATASEIDGSTGLFMISRTGNLDHNLVVKYNLSGTAENGVDYKQIGNSITIPAGESRASIEIIPIQDNDITEADETVILTLIDPEEGLQAKFISNAKVIGGVATVTIINNANMQAIPTLQNWALFMLILLLFIISIKHNPYSLLGKKIR